ncbi:MAG TPA: hypothetical protein VFT95_22145, partial [Micromonosporaceae bacterium]|nr:hypothetical protein [Micromonosporaceae bacterium]
KPSSCRPRPRWPDRSTRPSAARDGGPILRNTFGRRMDRHAATRRLKHLGPSGRDPAGLIALS